MVSPFYFFVGIVSYPLVKWPLRLRTLGTANIPREGGFVLSANHVSNFDPWPLGIPLWPKRQLRFMAKVELFRSPLWPILKGVGAFKVHRGQGDEEAMRKAIQLAREGEVVVIFPEGTRREKGLVKKFQAKPHTGAARVALAAGVPLVPAAIAGTDNLRRLGPLRVVYGPPVDLDDLQEQEPREAARVGTERLMTAIGELEKGL